MLRVSTYREDADRKEVEKKTASGITWEEGYTFADYFTADKYLQDRAAHDSNLKLAVKYRHFETGEADNDPKVILLTKKEHELREAFEAKPTGKNHRAWKEASERRDLAYISARTKAKEHAKIRWAVATSL